MAVSGLTRAFIGLGANLRDPVQQIVDARALLYRLPETDFGRSSSLYLSSPVGYADQADFVNCVVELMTRASVTALFTEMQAIEKSLGRLRVPGNQSAPRSIDLDLLLFGDLSLATESLTVPHPRMSERLFVLEPLLELAAGDDLENFGSVSSIISNRSFNGQVIHRLSVG